MTVLPLVLDGTETFALDAIHHKALEAAPSWPLAAGVLAAHGGECDLVLIAVPAGKGVQVASYLADGFGIDEESER